MTLDLPQPFGPTTPTKFEGKDIFVGSTKLLKPDRFILNYCSLFNHSFGLILYEFMWLF